MGYKLLLEDELWVKFIEYQKVNFVVSLGVV